MLNRRLPSSAGNTQPKSVRIPFRTSLGGEGSSRHHLSNSSENSDADHHGTRVLRESVT